MIDFENKFSVGQGRLLVSNVLIKDEMFAKRVVLITEHDEKGVLGFILNKELSLDIRKNLGEDAKEIQRERLFMEYKADEFLTELPSEIVHRGGPVLPQTLHFIYFYEGVPSKEMARNSFQIIPNLYWGQDFLILKELFQMIPLEHFRFFMGHASWEHGQLEEEIAEKSWYVLEAPASLIFKTRSELLWGKCLDKLGNHYKMLLNYPKDILLN